MPGWNVRNYGDTRLTRLADRLDFLVGDILLPVFILLLMSVFITAILAGAVALILHLIGELA